MLCDAPLLLYGLIQFGLGDDARVQTAVDNLAGLICENGWPCAVSPDLGQFRILRVPDVLTQFPWVREDARLAEMMAVVSAKAGEDGRFTPEGDFLLLLCYHLATGFVTRNAYT